MLLAEPPRSQGDIHFRLFGMPARIHPFFWIVALLLGISSGGKSPPAEVLGWMVALLVSILIHELGHAIVQRRYGGRPRIILYGMGGMTVCDDCDRSPKAQILISLAGPCAGFLFAVAMMLLIRLAGQQAGCVVGENSIAELQAQQLVGLTLLGVRFYWERFDSFQANLMIFYFLQINILWGAMNLLPIYPLDGGRISRELCLLGNPRRGIVLSLQISVAAALIMALVGLSLSFFVILLFGYLAYSSYQTLQAYQASRW